MFSIWTWPAELDYYILRSSIKDASKVKFDLRLKHPSLVLIIQVIESKEELIYYCIYYSKSVSNPKEFNSSISTWWSTRSILYVSGNYLPQLINSLFWILRNGYFKSFRKIILGIYCIQRILSSSSWEFSIQLFFLKIFNNHNLSQNHDIC